MHISLIFFSTHFSYNYSQEKTVGAWGQLQSKGDAGSILWGQLEKTPQVLVITLTPQPPHHWSSDSQLSVFFAGSVGTTALDPRPLVRLPY